MAKTEPSLDQWLAEAKADPKAAQCGMFLTHNGAVLLGADIRPNCIDALQKLVGKIKNDLVVEKEIYA